MFLINHTIFLKIFLNHEFIKLFSSVQNNLNSPAGRCVFINVFWTTLKIVILKYLISAGCAVAGISVYSLTEQVREIAMQKILVIDDDMRLVENVAKYMQDFGFHIESALNGVEGLDMVESFAPDLIVLDLMMPGLDGVEVCREIRKKHTIPVIMLTARTEEIDVVAGLEVGADDYITKPFSLRELVARIKARLRQASTAGTLQAHKGVIICDSITIDSIRREVYKKGKNPQETQTVTLTGTEFNLLWMMASNPGVVFSREKLLEELRSRELEAFDRSIDAHISHLRKKIEDTPKTPRYIITVWGTGYKFQGG